MKKCLSTNAPTTTVATDAAVTTTTVAEGDNGSVTTTLEPSVTARVGPLAYADLRGSAVYFLKI